MIQRIQTLHLLLTTILPALFLKGTILRFINNTGSEIIMNFTGVWQRTADGGSKVLFEYLPVSVLIILIPVCSIIAILMYKNRKLQMKITLILICLIILLIILICYFGFSVTETYEARFVPRFKAFIPLIMLVSGVLALRGIKRDDTLVRSYDRLR